MIINKLKIDVFIIYCANTSNFGEWRKPNTKILSHLHNNIFPNIAKAQFSYIGDMDIDKEFARNAGINFLDSREYFKETTITPTQIATYEEIELQEEGLYTLAVFRSDNKWLNTGEIAIVELTDTEEWTQQGVEFVMEEILLDHEGEGFIQLIKRGEEKIKIKKGHIMGKIVQDEIKPGDQQIIGICEQTTIAPLIGSPHDLSEIPTTATKILESEESRGEAKRVAQETIKEWRLLTKEKIVELKDRVKKKREEGKELHMNDKEKQVEGLTTDFKEAKWYNKMDDKNNPNSDRQDGISLEEWAERAEFPQFSDKLEALSNLEFLAAMGIDLFKHESGEDLSLWKHRDLLEKAVTHLFLFRNAGLLRLDYNKKLDPIGGVQYKINLKPGEGPIDYGIRNYSRAEVLEICKQVQQLINAGICAPSRSGWSSSIVLIRKHDKTWRMCVDLRGVNKKMIPVVSQLPLIGEVLRETFANGDLSFSSLDMSQAYHQLTLEEGSREILSMKLPRVGTKEIEELGFISPTQVSWLRLPFGISEAVSSFSNLMLDIFTPKGHVPYLDDMGVSRRTVAESIDAVFTIFKLCAKHGLTMGNKLCLYRNQIKFLGYKVSKEGIGIDEGRVEELLKMETPRTVTALREYLGCVGFCRDFLLCEFASVTAILDSAEISYYASSLQ